MSARKRKSSQRSIPNPVELERLIEEWGIRRELDRFIEMGCNLKTIAMLLALLKNSGTMENWETRTGFSRRNLNTVVNRMVQCASDIERLNASGYGQILFTAATDDQTNSKAYLLAIPRILRGYAEFVKTLAHEKTLQPRAKQYSDHLRAVLTQYVIGVTGQPRDNEVARLLSVALDRPELTSDSQKDWRSKHREILRTVATLAADLMREHF
jgi:hypothetical protein